MVTVWDWVLARFRLALAESLREEGYDVTFVCADGKYVDRFQERGFRWVEWESKRKRLNPLAVARALFALSDIYAREQPDLIHHDTIKPNLYGPLAIKLNQIRGQTETPPQVIDTFMGLGYVFSDGLLPLIIQTLIWPFLTFAVNRPYVHLVFSNESDRERLRDGGILRHNRTDVLMSEFVDTDTFQPFAPDRLAPEAADEGKNDAPVVLMAVRLLWAKGVGEFVEAARILEERGVEAQFWLAGEPDTDSAGFVPEDQLREWEHEGVIEWLGYQTDMPTLMNQADVAALPTKYNEGMPRFLVESAACGLPIVATDHEACRIVVREGETGMLVPPGEAGALADALEKLLTDAERRRAMGRRARDVATDEFDEEVGTANWHRLYARLLSR
jgi:glycosyltransferase involved in cell wall biosynthesis